MQTFKDGAGRTWTVAISIDTVRRVKTLLQINLLDVVEGDLIERLSRDVVLVCDVLYCAIKPDADAAGVTDVEFGRSMYGDALERGTAALLDAIVDFFRPAQRELLKKALGKLRDYETRAIALASNRLDSADLAKVLDARLAAVENGTGS